jgi:Na+/H+ antiporter NhaD/arsenite permease-like protein
MLVAEIEEGVVLVNVAAPAADHVAVEVRQHGARGGQVFSAWKFLKVGLVVMPPALVLSLASLLLLSR